MIQQRSSSSRFLQGALVSSFWHGQGCPLFDVVHPAFPLPTTALPTLQGALKDGFGEAVMACGMPEPCQFPFLDSCQKRFLWTHKEVDLAPHSVLGLKLQVENTKKFPHALGFENQNPFCFSVSEYGPYFRKQVSKHIVRNARPVKTPSFASTCVFLW